MSVVLPLARPPFSRLQPATLDDVDKNLRRLEQQQQGMFVPKVLVAARSPYTVQGTDWLILCDCTAGAITLTFPLAARQDGFYCMVIKTDASANAVTLSGTFNGVVNPTLTKQYQSKTINAGNGSYYFVPTLTAADILPGTFPGNYVISGTLEVDGNFSVNTTKFTVTASSGNTSVAGTLGVTGVITTGTSATGYTPSTNTQLIINERIVEQIGPGNIIYHTYSVGGTMASPTATPTGRFLWTLGARGYDGSAYTGDKGRLAVITTENWSSTANGTQLIFATTANGTTTLTTRLTIDQDGTITFASDPFLARRSTSMTDGAAAATGTLTNAPAAGNPTKWLAVNDNGTTRYIPAW